MGFIDSYKHLERICGDLLKDDRRVSAYIDEMIKTPRGAYLVKGWNEDLRQLKHCRWIRNQIVHEPGCTEENMCHPDDALWLDTFYSRIINQTDPLALYRKATQPRPIYVSKGPMVQMPACATELDCNDKEKSKKSMSCAMLILAIISVPMVFVFLAVVIFLMLSVIR